MIKNLHNVKIVLLDVLRVQLNPLKMLYQNNCAHEKNAGYNDFLNKSAEK